MKKIIVFSFLLISLFTHGQDDQRKKDSMALFAPTAKGKPDGEPVSRMMSKDGGSLISPDKKVELIIPPGALSSETMISIQPSVNLATAGVGKAYSFEPSGIQFQQPVQMIFHYTDKDMDGDSPQLMAISMQDEKGSWYRLRNIKLDTLAKTITGTTRHFSLYAMSWGIVLNPRLTRIKVSRQVEVELYVAPASEYADEADRFHAVAAVFDYQYQNPRNWSVNSVPDGDAAVGKIIKSSVREVTSVIYKAPEKIPDVNPVQIVVEIKGVEIFDRFVTVTKKCTILVYDDLYEVNMIATMKAGDKSSWGGKKTYYDEGSFMVSLDTKTPTILDIKNKLEILTDNCKKTILNPGTNTGMIHITGVKGIKVTPAESPGGWERVVEIAFIMRKAEFSMVKYDCPPPPGYIHGNASGTNIPGLGLLQSIPAQPVFIKFMAKEGEQIIYQQGKEGGELFVKFTVKQIKED